MDIDDDGTQRAATVKDYGLKPDFDELDDEAKEVRGQPPASFCQFVLTVFDRTVLKRSVKG